jgi:perosamine synthetase
MSKSIPLSAPYLGGKEWVFAKQCFDTNWLSSSGKFIGQFEETVGRLVKSPHAIAVSCGTSALHLALKYAGVKAGTEVILPTVTFISPVNAVHYLAAQPVFMDCDGFYNIDEEKTCAFIREETIFRGGKTYNKKTKRPIVALVPVHVFGNAARLDKLVPLCRERNIAVIEDATESLGTVYTKGKYKGKHAGTIGHIGCLSFNGNKIITTGGGGMVLTADKTAAERMRYWSTQAKDDALQYIHDDVGYNYRLSNVHAAIGLGQLNCFSQIKKNKKAHYAMYRDGINDIEGLHIAQQPDYADNNSWMVPLQIDRKRYGRGKDELIRLFRKEDVEVRPLWYLNHLQKPYKHAQAYKIETAYRMLDVTLNLPCGAGLNKNEISHIMRLLKKWQRS